VTTPSRSTPPRRGTIKSFREHLNAKYADGTLQRHRHFHQSTRGYGDYLYHQDRDKFDFELMEAIAGNDHEDWIKP